MCNWEYIEKLRENALFIPLLERGILMQSMYYWYNAFKYYDSIKEKGYAQAVTETSEAFHYSERHIKRIISFMLSDKK